MPSATRSTSLGGKVLDTIHCSGFGYFVIRSCDANPVQIPEPVFLAAKGGIDAHFGGHCAQLVNPVRAKVAEA